MWARSVADEVFVLSRTNVLLRSLTAIRIEIVHAITRNADFDLPSYFNYTMPVSIHVVPSDAVLLAELLQIKDEHPGIGVQRLSGQVHELHPDWRVNAKRVRKILKAHGLIAPAPPSPGTSPACVASPLAQSTQSDNSDDVGDGSKLSSSVCSNASASGDDQDRGQSSTVGSAAGSSFIKMAEARGSGFVVVDGEKGAAAAEEGQGEQMAMGDMDDEEWVLIS